MQPKGCIRTDNAILLMSYQITQNFSLNILWAIARNSPWWGEEKQATSRLSQKEGVQSSLPTCCQETGKSRKQESGHSTQCPIRQMVPGFLMPGLQALYLCR